MPSESASSATAGMACSTDDFAAADEIVRRFHERGVAPAISYGIVRDGELVHAAGFGERSVGGPVAGNTGPGNTGPGNTGPGNTVPDERTVFRIASMSKSFTASAILLLRDEGALGLDDPAARYVPELAGWVNGAADAGPLTIRHLLTMTAGFPTDDPWGDRQQGLPLDEFRALLAGGVGFNWAPGTRFEYSNLGYAILGLIVTAASGVPYDEFIRTRLLTPLGLARTGFAAQEFPGRRARRRPPARAGRLAAAAVRPVRRVRADGRRVLLRRRPRDLVRGVRRGVPAGRCGQRTAGGRGGPPPARGGLQAAHAAAAGGDRLACAAGATGRAAGRAGVLRLRAVRRRGPGGRAGW